MQNKVRFNLTMRVGNLTADFAYALHYIKDFSGAYTTVHETVVHATIVF